MNIPEPTTILFVCKGNVGRSQFAEVLYNKYASGPHMASSAGTALSGHEQRLSELPHIEHMRDAIEELGEDFSSLYRKQLSKEMLAAADAVVFLLQADDPLPGYAQHAANAVRWDVPDPKGTDLDRHREIRDQIKALILKNFS